MGFLNPLALTLAALAIPILILYMLRLRRKEVLVSSTFLWRRLMRDREANTPWQRLRRNLLMLLQLLILALLVLTLTRPYFPSPAVVRGSVVILLDASASMQATDGSPSRFEVARRRAHEIVDGLRPGHLGAIIAVGARPRTLAVTDDRATLTRALNDARPTDGPADWEAAAALAAAAATGTGDTQTVIISDGAMAEPLPSLPGQVHFLRVGERGENVAITALALREGSEGPEAFLRLSNFANEPVEAMVELRIDGALFDVRSVTLPADEDLGLTLDDLPYDLSLLEAQLTGDDLLPVDDAAWAPRGRSSSWTVLLITSGNLFLERALEMLAGVELTRVDPDSPLPSEPYDLVVYDGEEVATATLPAQNVWAIGPYGGASGIFTDTTVTDLATDDPLLRYVDLDQIHVSQAWRVEPPPGARVLVEAQGGPLLFVAQRPEGRLAVLTFDLHDSDLPLRVAFPILTANLTGWLLPHGEMAGGASAQPGESIHIQPAPEAERIVVTRPDGSEREFTLEERPPVLAETEQVGVYQVAQFGAEGELLQEELLVVNLFNEAESDIEPGGEIAVGEAEVTVAQAGETVEREFWPWLAAAALAVLIVEWWVYQRGSLGRWRG